MRRNRRAAAIFLAGTCLGCLLVYGGYYLAFRASFASALAAQGYKTVSIKGFKPYLDGLVVEKLQADHLTFRNLYISGGPVLQLLKKPRYYYVDELTVDLKEIFKREIRWPLAVNVPLTISHVRMSYSLLNRDIGFDGHIKQNPGTPVLFDFASTSPELTFSGQTEIRIKDHLVTSVDLQFHDAAADFHHVKSRRSDGWLSFTFDKGWSLIGEIESGFCALRQHDLYDAALKLNGPVEKIDFAFSGNDRKRAAWVFDQQDERLYVRHADATKSMAWPGLGNAMLVSMAGVMDSFAVDAKEAKQTEKIADKTEKEKAKPKPKPETMPEAAKPVPEKDQVLKLPPEKMLQPPLVIRQMTLPQIAFDTLVSGSLFAGFSYDRPLVQVARQCLGDEAGNCWIAQGQGGHFGYNPENLPGYFLRQSNYEESQQFRKMLVSFEVQSIRLQGKGAAVQDVTLSGRNAQGQPAYIELSVDGLE